MTTPLLRNARTLVLFLAFLSFFQVQAQLQVRTEVYPGVELLNVIHLLSDSVETIPSTYSVQVRKHFNAYKDHPAVQKARALALINCDFPLRHSWCFYNFPAIKLHKPDTLWGYNKYATTDAVIDYFNSCVDFYNDSKFWDFYKGQQPVYAQWIASFNRNLYDAGMLASIDSFYRLHPSGKVVFSLGVMNCNSFALPETGVINPVYKGISTILVAYGNLGGAKDSTAPDFYSRFTSQLIWHEAGHVYLADLFLKYAKEIDALQSIFINHEQMKQQAGSIGWKSYLDENITQSVTTYLRIHTGRVARDAEISRVTRSGYYLLLPDLLSIIEEQYIDKRSFKNFDEFFPVLLNELARKYPH